LSLLHSGLFSLARTLATGSRRITVDLTYSLGQFSSANQINNKEDHLEDRNLSAHIAQRRHAQHESQNLFAVVDRVNIWLMIEARLHTA